MPSHSKKQHNFMEAIAHSPSFAKKVGVPQSVGKDYAAADKGKTFSKGGEMKESMVGKEVAFMKKKGAPKSMIKHEETEMKRGGKVRRMAGGGMGAYDPFALSDEDVANYEKNGAKNESRLRNFFMGRRSEGEASAPIEERANPVTRSSMREVSSNKVSSDEGPRTPSGLQRKFGSTVMPSVAEQMAEREKGGSNYGPDYGADSTYSDYGDNSGSSSQTFIPSKRKSGTRRPVTVSETKETKSVTATPSNEKTSTGAMFKSDLEGRLEQMKPKRKVGMASDETREAVRKGLGSAFDFFNLSKRHEQEFGKKAAKGGPVKKMAAGGRVKKMGMGGLSDFAQNTPTQSGLGGFGTVLNGGQSPMQATQSPMQATQQPSGGLSRLGQAETQSKLGGSGTMINSSQPLTAQETQDMGELYKNFLSQQNNQKQQDSKYPEYKGPMQPQQQSPGMSNPYSKNMPMDLPESFSIQPGAKMPPGLDERNAGGVKPDTQPLNKAQFEKNIQEAGLKPQAKPSRLDEIQAQSQARLAQRQQLKERTAAMKASRQSPMATKPLDSNPMVAAPTDASMLKTGGKVKKMATGGFTRAADGVAQKGKTQGKVVKMASGGFVKTADGCAQRGKTKAFQVKMSRGGKC